jgi:hypothetical protein
MDSDAPSLTASGESSWSSNRRMMHAQFLRALERMRSIDDPPVYEALHAFVDTLVMERITPEGSVIAVKEAILRSTCLSRFEQPVRERVRSSIVAACIDRYYDTREATDVRSATARAARHLRVESRTSDDADASA